MIIGLQHVQLNVPAEGADVARRFYGETLALEEMPRPDSLSQAGRNGLWYRLGEQELHIYFNPRPGYAPDGGSQHPAFTVDGLDGLRARLEAAGHEIEEAIPIQGRARFFCRDPFGNRLEFLAFR